MARLLGATPRGVLHVPVVVHAPRRAEKIDVDLKGVVGVGAPCAPVLLSVHRGCRRARAHPPRPGCRLTRVLVAGAAGVIGMALVPALTAAGFDVQGFDRTFDPEQDLVSGDALADALRGCEGVIHLAACSLVAEAEADPTRAHRDNVEATVALLRAVSTQPRPPWVFASSREVYGRADVRPVREDSMVAPVNVYGATKAEAEALVQRAAAKGLGATILRLANVYGAATDHADRLVPDFVGAALAGRALGVRGSDRTLDLVHIRDAVGAIVAAAEALMRGDAGAGAINVCSGVETTLSALARRVVTLSVRRAWFTSRSPALTRWTASSGTTAPRAASSAGCRGCRSMPALLSQSTLPARLRRSAIAAERMLQ
jgi:UDP-glucose 4-epimerase